MDTSKLKQQIKDKQLDNFYIFTGDEIGIMNIYISKISSILACLTSRVDNLSSVYKKLENKSILAQKTLYVIRDDNEFYKAEDVWERFKNHTIKTDDVIIMVYTNIDKRSKFSKYFADTIISFDYMKTEVLMKYVKKEITLSDNNSRELIEICENDYSRILLEIDKIKSYDSSGNNYDEAYTELKNQGVIYKPPKDAIFDFVNAVASGKLKLSFDLLAQSYSVGESPVVLLSVLYTTFKQLLQVQSFKGDDICKSTGLTPFQVKCAKSKVGVYSTAELVNVLRVIREAEKSIKTGLLEAEMSVDYVLVNIL